MRWKNPAITITFVFICALPTLGATPDSHVLKRYLSAARETTEVSPNGGQILRVAVGYEDRGGRVSSVPPGSGYTIAVDMQGFVPDFRTDPEVNAGDNRELMPPFVLQPRAEAPRSKP